MRRTLIAAVAASFVSVAAFAAAGPTTLSNLWNFGSFHNGIVGLAVQDSSGNIAPGFAPYDKNGAPNDSTHPVWTKAGAAGDVCQDPNVAKSSAVISIGAAATTKVVDVSASTAIYVCGFTASTAGTATTVTWKYGTHASADCDTAAASLSGAFNYPIAGTVVTYGNGTGTIFKTPAAQQLCVTTAGSGSAFTGLLTYVQQ